MYVSGKADAGASLLLDAIAAVVIGGASMFGGSGTVGRTMIGALIIAVLDLGLRMSGTPTFDKYILVGVILILAVIMERYMQEKAVMDYLLETRNITKRFGGLTAVDQREHRRPRAARPSPCWATTAPASRRSSR